MSLSYALLGFLNYAPMTGYDLKKVFDDSINFFWSAQMSQIYRELKSLEKSGAVISSITSGDKGPDKRVYSITEQGVASLKSWLSTMPDEDDEDIRNAFLVRVFFSAQVGIDELYFQMQTKLKKYKADYQKLKVVEEKLKGYAQMVGNDTEIHYWKIVLSRGFYAAESSIRWAEESLEYLANLKEAQADD